MYASRSVFEPTHMGRESESGSWAVCPRVLWTPTCFGRFNSQAAAASWGLLTLVSGITPARPALCSRWSASCCRRRCSVGRTRRATTSRRRPRRPDAAGRQLVGQHAAARPTGRSRAGQRPLTPANASKGGLRPPGLPARVKRALDANKVVVLLFWNPEAVDDRSVKAPSPAPAPRRQSRSSRTGPAPLALHADHRGCEVTQTPSLVIVNRRGAGRGPDRLPRLRDDQPVRGERAAPLSAAERCHRRLSSIMGLGAADRVRRAPERTPTAAGLCRRARSWAAPAALPAATSCASRSRARAGVDRGDVRCRGLRRDLRGRKRMRDAGRTGGLYWRRPHRAGAIAAELGGLSPGKRHAADLAADALHRALSKAGRRGRTAVAGPRPRRWSR